MSYSYILTLLIFPELYRTKMMPNRAALKWERLFSKEAVFLSLEIFKQKLSEHLIDLGFQHWWKFGLVDFSSFLIKRFRLYRSKNKIRKQSAVQTEEVGTHLASPFGALLTLLASLLPWGMNGEHCFSSSWIAHDLLLYIDSFQREGNRTQLCFSVKDLFCCLDALIYGEKKVSQSRY